MDIVEEAYVTECHVAADPSGLILIRYGEIRPKASETMRVTNGHTSDAGSELRYRKSSCHELAHEMFVSS